jgi:hypothetical protein
MNLRIFAPATIFFCLFITLCFSNTNEITISGQYATGESGVFEFAGEHEWEVIFYDGEISMTHVGDKPSTGNVEILTTGHFSIKLTLPSDAIGQNELWYQLAIDTDDDGIDADDVFDQRFQITSVPFSVTGQATPFFTAFGGASNPTGPGPNPNLKLSVAPFFTPAGGVEFNRMSILVDFWSSGILSFGVYDKTGNLVASSGDIALPGYGYNTYQIIEVTLNERNVLQPSELYYIGWTASSDAVNLGFGPVIPAVGYGYIAIPDSGGTIPSSFDPTDIQSSGFFLALSVSFRLVE